MSNETQSVIYHSAFLCSKKCTSIVLSCFTRSFDSSKMTEFLIVQGEPETLLP